MKTVLTYPSSYSYATSITQIYSLINNFIGKSTIALSIQDNRLLEIITFLVPILHLAFPVKTFLIGKTFFNMPLVIYKFCVVGLVSNILCCLVVTVWNNKINFCTLFWEWESHLFFFTPVNWGRTTTIDTICKNFTIFIDAHDNFILGIYNSIYPFVTIYKFFTGGLTLLINNFIYFISNAVYIVNDRLWNTYGPFYASIFQYSSKNFILCICNDIYPFTIIDKATKTTNCICCRNSTTSWLNILSSVHYLDTSTFHTDFTKLLQSINSVF